ncbi:hypothetical protein [Streptomyces mangrovisoli]|uniref:Uncharacterized protein n=1 Tax=Streptomyces mangrovisoli TaxID=1428628 RepID=A0A1J4NJQ6_9ACTN|nr:hypothetical protein [Streptomyces mangrovisoli]OIJ62535.1 hypothetical protein WN71_039015 [Streptomyces mangrovisoli]
MKSQDTPFEGGPMDGRVLPVLLGPTGHPPKIYRIPVPAPDGGEPTVLVYRREPRAHSKRLGTPQGWKYAYDPGADPRSGTLRWPWSRRSTAANGRPGATPSGRPENTDG